MITTDKYLHKNKKGFASNAFAGHVDLKTIKSLVKMMSNKQDIVLALYCAVLCSVILNRHEWTFLGVLAILVALYFTATLKEPEKVFIFYKT